MLSNAMPAKTNSSCKEKTNTSNSPHCGLEGPSATDRTSDASEHSQTVDAHAQLPCRHLRRWLGWSCELVPSEVTLMEQSAAAYFGLALCFLPESNLHLSHTKHRKMKRYRRHPECVLAFHMRGHCRDAKGGEEGGLSSH